MTDERRVELIRWVDAHAAGGAWIETNRVAMDLPNSLVLTLGWVVHEDAERLIVASSHFEDWAQVGEVIAIPLEAIRSRVRIVVPNPGPGEPSK